MKATGALGVGTGIALTAGATAAAETPPDVGTNAFNNVGPATIINTGASIPWTFSFGGDAGFQIAGPNILAPLNGARLSFFNFAKSNLNGAVTYFVTIRNDTGPTAVHNLQGGGAA
jgi:hypothetical protein